MKTGMLKHPYLGDTKAYTSNNRQLLQIKVSTQKNQQWFKHYDKYKDYQWKYCLYPTSVTQQQDQHFNSPIPKKYSIQNITYVGYYVTSLKDQILTRAKNNAKFAQKQILYIAYTIACAWRQWKSFCKRYQIDNNYFAISSQHVFFNQDGDIKLITPLTSPLQLPTFFYYAPQNLPPNAQHQNSWNKSIMFSIGLIAAEMLTQKLVTQFYQYKGPQLKFIYEQYQKCIKLSQKKIKLEIFNLILLMTDKNPFIRLKIGQFQAILAPYHELILDGQLDNISRQKSKASLLQYLKKKKNNSVK